MTDSDRIEVVREIWKLAYDRGVPPERVLDEYETAAHERLRARDTLPAPPPRKGDSGEFQAVSPGFFEHQAELHKP